MAKDYKRNSFTEIIKGEILGLVFGFLGSLLVMTLKKESPSSLFYIIPAVLGISSLVVDLVGNLKPFIRTDQEKIVKYKFSLLKKEAIAVSLPWQKIKEVDLNLVGFIKYKFRLSMKSNDQCLTAENTISDFKDLLSEVFSRATNATLNEETKMIVSRYFKELSHLIIGLSTKPI
jgi:uncharacterized membrane protein YeaQ/YmgE (transglycosylase-associated protein family)